MDPEAKPETAANGKRHLGVRMWSPEWLEMMAHFDENHNNLPPELFKQYEGQIVAWYPDGSGVRDADVCRERLQKRLRDEGEDPQAFVYGYIESV